MENSNPLKISEPEFYEVWIIDQYPGDPQVERWLDLESKQLALAESKVSVFSASHSVRGKRVLDVGCQWGATTIAFARHGAKVTGIDIRSEFIEGAALRTKEQGVEAVFFVSPAENIDAKADTFDVVYCTNVIEHVRSHEKSISEFSRVLKPGGILFMDGPNRLSLHFLWKDPHYRMSFVSILPHWLGHFYVKNVRRYPAYDVGVFPMASRIDWLLRRHGFQVLTSWKTNYLSQAKPSFMRRTRAETLHNLVPMFSFSAMKQVAPIRLPESSRQLPIRTNGT